MFLKQIYFTHIWDPQRSYHSVDDTVCGWICDHTLGKNTDPFILPPTVYK